MAIGKHVYLERLHEGSTVDCKPEVNDVVQAIMEEYIMSGVGIDEVLATTCIHGLSVEDVVTVYAQVYKNIEGDEVVRIAEGEKIDLSKESLEVING